MRKGKPNIFISLMFGVIYLFAFFGAYILLILLFGSLHILFTLIWFILAVGIVVGFQIHLVRKLKWLDESDN